MPPLPPPENVQPTSDDLVFAAMEQFAEVGWQRQLNGSWKKQIEGYTFTIFRARGRWFWELTYPDGYFPPQVPEYSEDYFPSADEAKWDAARIGFSL